MKLKQTLNKTNIGGMGGNDGGGLRSLEDA